MEEITLKAPTAIHAHAARTLCGVGMDGEPLYGVSIMKPRGEDPLRDVQYTAAMVLLLQTRVIMLADQASRLEREKIEKETLKAGVDANDAVLGWGMLNALLENDNYEVQIRKTRGGAFVVNSFRGESLNESLKVLYNRRNRNTQENEGL
jgi:hypothetical protein